MDRYLSSFAQAVERVQPLLDVNQIQSRVGTWRDSAVLKLQKDEWTGEGTTTGPAGSGIFFSVWVDTKALKLRRAFYNIHALKLRQLPAYSLTSREFAAVFRAKFSESSTGWPHVSTDFGPQTLMQGWIELDKPERLAGNLNRLIHQFVEIHSIIDTLLAQHKKH